MIRWLLALGCTAALVECSGPQSCSEKGGTCAVTCPSGTEPLTAAEYATQVQTTAYGCPGDGAYGGIVCCLPVPVTN
jgi:hypothetical protein